MAPRLSPVGDEIFRALLLLLREFVPPERLGTPLPEAPLLGAFPELDSMALVELVAAIEERFGIVFENEDLREESFATLRHLVALIETRQRAVTKV